jgi:Transposase zinc-binding domain
MNFGVMSALELCRTAALGGHIEECDKCQHQRNAYNSCHPTMQNSRQ